MIDFKPKLQSMMDPVGLAMVTKDPKHMKNSGVVGFSGSRDYGGIVKDFTGRGESISELGTKIGTEAVMRNGSLGAAGINRPDASSFSDVMLQAMDRVSGSQMRVADLEEAAIINPASVDAHDLTTAQAEASLELSVARTLLSRLTQAWKDIINTR
jgi:flagellar hook-basal body complex protein FliE